MTDPLLRRLHEMHRKIGTRSQTCPLCWAEQPETHKPRWLEKLAPKDMTRGAA